MGQIGSFGQARRAARCLSIGQAAQRRPRGRFAPPEAGFFCAPASLPVFSDVPASPCDGRLAGAQKNPGQMVPIYLEPLSNTIRSKAPQKPGRPASSVPASVIAGC